MIRTVIDYDDDCKITLEDCEDQIRVWAKALARKRNRETTPEGKQLAKLKGIKRSALDSIMESEAANYFD